MGPADRTRPIRTGRRGRRQWGVQSTPSLRGSGAAPGDERPLAAFGQFAQLQSLSRGFHREAPAAMMHILARAIRDLVTSPQELVVVRCSSRTRTRLLGSQLLLTLHDWAG
jgi:hypothetical protein